MEKCTFCDHRRDIGLEPACVTACPLEALSFEENTRLVPVDRAGFPDTGLGPAIRVDGSRRQTAPEMTAAPTPKVVSRVPGGRSWEALRSEWSLWAFTSIAMLLVAWFTAATVQAGSVFLPVFAISGIAAMSVSALHLGRISRIWRAAINVRGSWISREVVLFSAFFFGVCILTSIRTTSGGAATWTVVIVGFAAMFSMDMVYRVPGQPMVTVPHSAMALLTSAFYLGLLLDLPTLVLPVAAVKLSLYLVRRDAPLPGRPVFAIVRIGMGIVLPVFLLAVPGVEWWVILGSALVGELVDRAEFYAGLRFLTPERQIARDLERAA
jgi:hypothetical protein